MINALIDSINSQKGLKGIDVADIKSGLFIIEGKTADFEECFGIPKGRAVVGLAIGIIILAGLSILLKELLNITIPWWPLVVILIEILVIIGAIRGLRRS